MGLGLLKRMSWIRRWFGTAGALLVTGTLLLTGTLAPVRAVSAEEGNEENSGANSIEGRYREEEVEEVFPVYYDEWSGSSEDIIILEEEEREYLVRSGDCLWDISEKLWGDGRWYGRLTAADGERLENPDLIYPGMMLRAAQKGYICKRHTQNMGMQTGEYSIDTPGSWTVGVVSSGNASANLVFSGTGLTEMACLVQDKREETVITTGDWEDCAARIQEYAEEHYGENVSDLTFEHYRTGQGEEVYLYSFLWQIELPDHPEIGKVGIRACMGLKLTEHIQAEFLGFSRGHDIHGEVRYTTASFEEHVEEYDPGTFTVNDSNMAILPEAKWELAGMYDPFSWMDEFFGALIEKAAGVEPEPESARKGLIEKIERPGGRR